MYKAKWHGSYVAAKLLKRSDEIALGDFRTEIAILRKIHHPNCTQVGAACALARVHGCCRRVAGCCHFRLPAAPYQLPPPPPHPHHQTAAPGRHAHPYPPPPPHPVPRLPSAPLPPPHPRLQFLGACTKQKPYVVITELMACSLADAFQRTFYAPSPRRMVEIALDFARGMAYLHSRRQPIVHRDLKPANLMIAGNLNADVERLFLDSGERPPARRGGGAGPREGGGRRGEGRAAQGVSRGGGLAAGWQLRCAVLCCALSGAGMSPHLARQCMRCSSARQGGGREQRHSPVLSCGQLGTLGVCPTCACTRPPCRPPPVAPHPPLCPLSCPPPPCRHHQGCRLWPVQVAGAGGAARAADVRRQRHLQAHGGDGLVPM